MSKPSRYESLVRQALRQAAHEGGWTARQISDASGAGIKETYRLLAKLRGEWQDVGAAPGGARLMAAVTELATYRAETARARMTSRSGGSGSGSGPGDNGVGLHVGDSYTVTAIVGVDLDGDQPILHVAMDGPAGAITATIWPARRRHDNGHDGNAEDGNGGNGEDGNGGNGDTRTAVNGES